MSPLRVRGVTIIELCISLICLVAVSVVVVSTVRQRGQASQARTCLSNQHATFIALASYLQDTGGALTVSDGQAWSSALRPYLPADTLDCPTQRGVASCDAPDFALNARVSGVSIYHSGLDPLRLCLFADGHPDTPLATTEAAFARRHQGRVVATFADGHAEQRAPTGLITLRSDCLVVSTQVADQEAIVLTSPDGTLRRTVTAVSSPHTNPSLSPDGQWILFTEEDPDYRYESRLFRLRADGTALQQLTAGPGSDMYASWSPDGQSVVFSRTVAKQSDLYVLHLPQRTLRRLTDTPESEIQAAWSPDGRTIAYAKRLASLCTLWALDCATGRQTCISPLGCLAQSPAWSPDGAALAFTMYTEQNDDIYRCQPDGSGLTRLTTRPGIERSPAWSPDGTRIAYLSTEGDTHFFQLFTMAANGQSQRQLTRAGSSISLSSAGAWR